VKLHSLVPRPHPAFWRS